MLREKTGLGTLPGMGSVTKTAAVLERELREEITAAERRLDAARKALLALRGGKRRGRPPGSGRKAAER